jgi:hypothetical protein
VIWFENVHLRWIGVLADLTAVLHSKNPRAEKTLDAARGIFFLENLYFCAGVNWANPSVAHNGHDSGAQRN